MAAQASNAVELNAIVHRGVFIHGRKRGYPPMLGSVEGSSESAEGRYNPCPKTVNRADLELYNTRE